MGCETDESHCMVQSCKIFSQDNTKRRARYLSWL